ncbi:MAG: methylenetetrahydrofolate reductase [NAD(P)H] [Burkholderiaceae bacterium]|nr:methylenetetrahydrofolate reductase [NAD(P)H] [Burkholderiaceae bacterium]
MSIPISFEFFPPNTPAGLDKLRDVRGRLGAIEPEYFSVTYGAGGSTQEKTFTTVAEMLGEGLVVAPHVSCIGATRESIDALLCRYRDAGVSRLVALRGDLPSGSGMSHAGDFRFASDLVAFIKERFGDTFRIEVAAYPEMHPQARSPQADLAAFVLKAKAGADAAITQYFYNADAYFDFRDSAARAGAGIPVVPGIMPITNYTQLTRFSDACGAEIPRWIRLKLAGYADDTASLRAFGRDFVSSMCQRLIDGGAPALHFYTLNQADPILEICRSLD